MNTPHGLWQRIPQGVGVLMVITALVWFFGQVMPVYLPPQRGLIVEEAAVNSLGQRGTFLDPAFAVTLSYEVAEPDGTMTTIRSGQRVDYDTYSRLEVGDTVMIQFDPVNPHDWSIITIPGAIHVNQIIPAAVLLILGLLVAIFPWLMRLGSRAGDFESNEFEHLQIS